MPSTTARHRRYADLKSSSHPFMRRPIAFFPIASDCRDPTGIDGGVLSAIPVHYGIAGPDFPPAIFSLIVTSIVVFCLGVALVGRMPDEAGTSA